MQRDSDIPQNSVFLWHNLIFGNWNKLEFTFSFITTFSIDKINPKEVGFFAYHYNGYIINLTLLT